MLSIGIGLFAVLGVIEKLRAYYNSTKNSLTSVLLCNACTHYSVSYGDRGWGCGYRNIQMLLSTLSKNARYQESIFSGK